MAGRFIDPYPQYLDATPDVYSGGQLFFYATGTSTPLDTYTTKALAVANPNPIVLNSAGRPAVDIFLQDLEYKVVLKDANDVTIWTADPVSHRDSLLVAKTLTGSGSPNGSVAGTAGSSSVLPDFYWDYTNSILYVCTTTGTSSTAVWTAINASSATAAVPSPQGRLTLTTATPILSSDTSNNGIYYTPYTGNLIPIYNGSTMAPTTFSELQLSLVASHAASTIYDIFVFSNSGVLTLVTGPAWTTSTAGSGARGTGASTTQLARVQGLWTNAVSMTARNGSTTYTVGANLATYVGSVFIDGSAGQTTCHQAYGQSRKWGLWNAYNRKQIIMQAGDATASWAYGTNTIRASNGTSANSATVFTGLPEEYFYNTFTQAVQGGIGSLQSQVISTWQIGIGFNSTTAFSGRTAKMSQRLDGNGAGTIDYLSQWTGTAEYIAVPAIGINVVNCLERTNAMVSSTVTYSGGSDLMQLTCMYQG